MFSAAFHPHERDSPNRRFLINLAPTCAECFRSTRRCQNRPLERSRPHTRNCTNIGKKRADSLPRQCGMVLNGPHLGPTWQQLIEVAPPPGRVFPNAPASGSRVIEDCFYPSPDPGCSLGLFAPDWLEHRPNLRSLNRGDGQVGDDGIDVGGERRVPLHPMDGVAPALLVSGDIFLCDEAERQASDRRSLRVRPARFPGRVTFGKDIAPCFDRPVIRPGELARFGQRHGARLGSGATKSHFSSLTVQSKAEHPRPGAARLDHQPKTVAIDVSPRPGRSDTSSRERSRTTRHRLVPLVFPLPYSKRAGTQ